MVDQVGIGGREFSVGRLADCRSVFTELALTALILSQPEVVCTSLKMPISHVRHEKIRRTLNTPRNLQQPIDRDNLETACD